MSRVDAKGGMKLVRSCVFCLACIGPSVHADAIDQSLIGCWRAVRIVLHAQDGSRIVDTSGRCTLQFREEQVESTCLTASGLARVTYQYRIVRPNFYVTTMAGSTFRTDLIGATREYEYHIDGDRLVTVNKTPASALGSPTVAARVESEAAKSPCP
jgi:hypothetical protein